MKHRRSVRGTALVTNRRGLDKAMTGRGQARRGARQQCLDCLDLDAHARGLFDRRQGRRLCDAQGNVQRDRGRALRTVTLATGACPVIRSVPYPEAADAVTAGDGRARRPLADPHRQIVVLGFIAEGPGHPAAAGGDSLGAGFGQDREGVEERAHTAERLGMTVAVDQEPARLRIEPQGSQLLYSCATSSATLVTPRRVSYL